MEIKRTANAGILLSLDGVRILLDGVCEQLPPYLGTQPGERESLLQDVPDLVAFTHVHPDHCDLSFVSDYLQKTAGPIMGPADIPFTSSTEQTVGTVKVTPVPSRHLGKANDVQHVSYIIEGSHCVWFMGDAAPSQLKQMKTLPHPDVLIAPFGFAIGSGWNAACDLSPQVFVLVHMPEKTDDPANLWHQVEQTVSGKPGPAVYIPELGQNIHFTA